MSLCNKDAGSEYIVQILERKLKKNKNKIGTKYLTLYAMYSIRMSSLVFTFFIFNHVKKKE